MIKWALFIASAARWAPALVYAVVVIVVASLIAQRAEGPPPTASRTLPLNHRIVAGDLETPLIREAMGRYVVAEVPQGRPVRPEDTSATLRPPKASNALAALINVSAAGVAKLGPLKAGDPVQICAGNTAYGGASRLISVDCDAASCAIWLWLDNPPIAPGAQDPLKGAWIITNPMNCSQPPP